MKRLWCAAALAMAVFAPGRVDGATLVCVAGPVSGFIGTTCSIGDKDFTFDSFIGRGITDAGIILTPDSTDPLSPGFVLTGANGPIVLSTTGQDQAEIFAQITYKVAVSSGDPFLAGVSVTLNNPSATGSGEDGSGPEIVDAFNFGFGSSTVFTEVCIKTAATHPLGCVAGPPYPASLTSSGTFTTPEISVGGQAGFSLNTSGTGTATFVSAEYNFNQVPPQSVPEPASLALLGIGLGCTAVFRRKQSKA